jgi:hypothetical protein
MSEVYQLIRGEVSCIADDLVADGVRSAWLNGPGDYTWESHGGTWAITYAEQFGEVDFDCPHVIIEPDEISLDVTFLCPHTGEDRTITMHNTLMTYSLPSGTTVAIDQHSLEYADGTDLLEVLGALVRSGAVMVNDALEAIEKDENYDDQHYFMFKVAYS